MIRTATGTIQDPGASLHTREHIGERQRISLGGTALAGPSVSRALRRHQLSCCGGFLLT
jgi:hypothetical protein